MRMRKGKGWAPILVVALLIGILPVWNTPVSKAGETSASAGKYGLKNPVVKAVSPPENTSHGLKNPRNDNGMVTWDCVYFGNYWKNDTNDDGVADKKDAKEPVKWRVLSVDGDDAFLLADTNLDVQRYNSTKGEDVTWKTCTMRSWLNGYGADENICGNDYNDNNFLDNAFTESEQEAIKNTTVVNEDNPKYGTEGGDDTTDKIYLLSLSEALNPSYGFTSAVYDTATREAMNTTYVAAGGETGSELMSPAEDMNYWWLRSPGHYSYNASDVNFNGMVVQEGYDIASDNNAVRPVLHLNLSSAGWSPAGTVSSDEGEMVSTWDCVWFGNYSQSDATGVAKDPIKWRVLSVNGDDAFLLADKNLDAQKYDDTWTEVTWETCTMRKWLNSSFLNKAFNASEQAAIKNTTVVNEDNPEYDAEGGNNTTDKIYLLSLSEALNPSYGFASTTDSTATREAVNTAYVAAGGEIGSKYMNPAGSTNSWWLRSPGSNSISASDVISNGYVNQYGNDVLNDSVAVRPVLHLNLRASSDALSASSWSYAGSVSSDGKENEIEASVPSPVAPTQTPETSGTEGISPSPAPASPQTTQNVQPQTTVTPEVMPESAVSKTVTPGKVTSLKLKAKKKAIQASWKKVSEAAGYEIQVSTSKKFTKKSTKTTKKTKLTINKLKPNKKYFVRVRAYHVVNGKKTYGKWSNIMNIKTKK